MTSTTNNLIGVGLYTVPEAARLTGAPAANIRRWLLGYKYNYKNEVHETRPTFKTDLALIDGKLGLTFLDMIEIRFVHAFRKHGVSWHTIRLAAVKAHELINSKHPFATTKFRTDGRTIFAELLRESGEESLLDLKRSQFAIQQVIKPSLYKDLEFADTDSDLLLRWWPIGKKRQVVIDPSIAFGQPIVIREGVPTSTLYAAFKVTESVKAVSAWYSVSTKSVTDAVAFEQKFAA